MNLRPSVEIRTPTEATGAAAVLREIPFVDPKVPPLNQVEITISGYRDEFFERRFANCDQLNIHELAKRGILAFLSKSRQIDEYYRLDSEENGIEPGVYRIRDEGAPDPLVTLKKHGNEDSLSSTLDIVNPDPVLIRTLRGQATLISVVEKTRTTYKSKQHANCLLHIDQVNGLGKFYDLKGDDLLTLNAFVDTVGLGTEQSVPKSYLKMKDEAGISKFQLAVWSFHRRFEDYVLGVVSGTLTPLGFLTATLASGGSRTAMILVLLSSGFLDGLSDSVAVGQKTQSEGTTSTREQASAFCKTMLGKVAIPLTFVPIVLSLNNSMAIGGASAAWAGLLLTLTAGIQALAHERPLVPAIAKALAWGAGAVSVGTILGQLLR